ncbi:MAG: hypothetical protein ACE5DO_08360 [Desulfobacterales bacterium]
MRQKFLNGLAILIILTIILPSISLAKSLKSLRKEAIREVDQMKDFTRQMVDMIFSFGELGFQEVETSRYITNILRENGKRFGNYGCRRWQRNDNTIRYDFFKSIRILIPWMVDSQSTYQLTVFNSVEVLCGSY